MLYRLIILTGPNVGQQLTVQRPSMTIGSGQDCEIRIADDEMANRHALLEHDETGLLIRDLGTMNKILVNHHEVEECRLKHGDEIEIGRTRFLLQAAVRAEVDTPKVFNGMQRKRKPRSVMVWVYLVAGLAMVYLFARPFLVIPEATSSSDPMSNRPATGTTVRATSASNRVVAGISDPSPTNATSRINTATNRPVSTSPTIPTNSNTAARPVHPTQAVVSAASISNTDIRHAQPTQAMVTVASVPKDPGTALTTRVASVRRSVPAANPVIKILPVEQHKFPSTESYEEMRTLTIRLQQTPAAEIERDSVDMDVTFFDMLPGKGEEKGNVAPSKMLVPRNPMKVAGPWSPAKPRIVTATYTVPTTSLPPGERRPQFYGFSIRVFHDGVLQDQVCRPADLRDLVPK